jgi:hypothetical protein
MTELKITEKILSIYSDELGETKSFESIIDAEEFIGKEMFTSLPRESHVEGFLNIRVFKNNLSLPEGEYIVTIVKLLTSSRP